jgi:hypothetical protein
VITLREFLPRVTLDFVWFACIGGAIATLWKGELIGESFSVGCLWLGLNTMLLGLLISALSGPKKPGAMTVTLLACAKIPLAYFLLLWLLSRDFIAPAGIIAALAALPVVMVARGLTALRKAPTLTTSKEGT